MSKKFSELVAGDKVWIIDNEANIYSRTIKYIKSSGFRTKIEFKEGDYTIHQNLNCSTMMTNLINKKDFIFVYIGTDKNELIDNYIENLDKLIDNCIVKIEEQKGLIENMDSKIEKIGKEYD